MVVDRPEERKSTMSAFEKLSSMKVNPIAAEAVSEKDKSAWNSPHGMISQHLKFRRHVHLTPGVWK